MQQVRFSYQYLRVVMNKDKSSEDFINSLRTDFAPHLEQVSNVMGDDNASLRVTLRTMAQVYKNRVEKGLPGATPETIVSDFIGLFSDLEQRISKIEQALHQSPKRD